MPLWKKQWGAGGSKKALKKILAALRAHEFVCRTDIASYYASISLPEESSRIDSRGSGRYGSQSCASGCDRAGTTSVKRRPTGPGRVAP